MKALILSLALIGACSISAVASTPTTCGEWTMRSKQVIVYASSESEARSEAQGNNPGWTVWSVRNDGGRKYIVSLKKD